MGIHAVDAHYEEAGIGLVEGNEALHTTFANVTVPALALSIVLLIAATVASSRKDGGQWGECRPTS